MFRREGNIFCFHAFFFHQTKSLADIPVGSFLRHLADSRCLFKHLSQMSGLGKKSCVIIRQAVLFHVTCGFLFLKLRLGFPDTFYPLVADPHRRQVGIREIPVILGVLLGTHSVGIFLIVIPPPGLLDHRASLFQKLDLPGSFSFNGSGNGLKGVQVFHLCPDSQLPGSHLSY